MNIAWITVAATDPNFLPDLARLCRLEVLRIRSEARLPANMLSDFDLILYDYSSPNGLVQPVPGIVVLRAGELEIADYSHAIRSSIGVVAFSADVARQVQIAFTVPVVCLSTAKASGEELLNFIDEVRSARPLLELADRLGSELNKIGVGRNDSAVEAVSQTLEELFVRENG